MPPSGGFISGEVQMKGTPAIYLGRIVEKKNFRTFVYGVDGQKKLVESWDAFEAAMQSGIWFSTVQYAELSKTIANEKDQIELKPKSRSRSKPKAQKVEDDVVDSVENDEMVF
jgi:hypothetical protein